ncbi:MAG TPA: radical SAM protein, partial [Methanocorpusculum sp.]|nr:radical SAM protein [Methanocorpusculum sp.]
MQNHDNQPFNCNHLRPCPCLDNPEKLASMVDKSGAKSTDLQNPEDVHVLTGKCKAVSDIWAERAEKLWTENRAEHDAKIAARSAEDQK